MFRSKRGWSKRGERQDKGTMYQGYQVETRKKVTWRPAPMELMRKPLPRRRTVSRVKTADQAIPLPPGTCILVLRVSSGCMTAYESERDTAPAWKWSIVGVNRSYHSGEMREGRLRG